MNQIKSRPNKTVLVAASSLLVVAAAVSCTVEAGELQLSRYQSVTLQPSYAQIDLMSNLVEIELPAEVKTVGQAISYLLEGSGYRLLSAKLAEPYRVSLFALPLPEVQRQLGPISLRDALELVSGPAFQLVIEPVYRLVTFALVNPKSETDVDS